MTTELDRLKAENDKSPMTYTLRLCPFETFDTSDEGIAPILNNLFIVCGDGSEAHRNTCTLDADDSATSQVTFVDSDFYDLDNVNIDGLTFQKFELFSIDLMANKPSELTITNAIWQVRN